MIPIEKTEAIFPARIPRLFSILAIFGGLVFLAGVVAAPDRIWPNVLLAAYYLIGLGLAGALFVAMQYVASAGWAVALRRVPEAMTTTLPVAAIAIEVFMFGGLKTYSWTGESFDHQPAMWFKALWLQPAFFIGRSIAYAVLWILLSKAIVSNSHKQDEDGAIGRTRSNVALSALFIVVFAITFCLASFDWIMSLEPYWYSTMFGVYNFTGMFLSGLAAMVFLLVWLKKLRVLTSVPTEAHLHAIGKLMFGFSFFWMYIWFSQYMLIWYANFPEETGYFVDRQRGAWGPLLLLNVALNWAVPFFILLPAKSKRNPDIMQRVACILLFGRWLDLYIMILPSSAGAKPVFGLWEIGPMIGAAGLFGLMFIGALKKASLIPTRDPYLVESLHLH